MLARLTCADLAVSDSVILRRENPEDATGAFDLGFLPAGETRGLFRFL
jgi:hypothetical protein